MNEEKCRHLFARRSRWWAHRVSWMRWECVRCAMRTRSYDSVDRMGLRPIHPHMSVAVAGINTVKEVKFQAPYRREPGQ